jgi:hypothetical protein
MDRKFVIWGIGTRGKSALDFIDAENVSAFIDNNANVVGTKYFGKPIVSLDEYLESYRLCFIVISMAFAHQTQSVEKQLAEKSVYSYFILNDCPCRSEAVRIEETPLYMNARHSNVIYGVSLFSVFLYYHSMQIGCERLCLVPQRTMNLLVLEQIKVYFPEVRIADIGKITDTSRIFLTVTDIEDYEACMKTGCEIENAYDFSDRIDLNHNPNIKKFRNVHKGKRCFIVCTGPSLNYDDLDKLHEYGEICISMNMIYAGFAYSKWRPDYYVCYDIRMDTDLFNGLDAKHKFAVDAYYPFWETRQSSNIHKYQISFEYDNDGSPKFSDDFSKTVFGSSSVTYVCLQLAVYMGFSEVYLIGSDFSFSTGSADHFTDSYLSTSKAPGFSSFSSSEPIMLALLEAFQKAKKHSDENGIKICNATRGGMLEVFERVDFDTLF